MNILYSIIILFILPVNSFSSLKQVDINPEFYKTWLNYEFFMEIEEGKTPRESMKMKTLMQVYFFENSDSVLIGNFNEGMRYKFIAVSYDTLIILNQFKTDQIEFKIWISNHGNEERLEIEFQTQRFLFKALDKKYYSRDGVRYYINDKFLTGNYVDISDSSKNISFNTDGSIHGLDVYTTYDIPLVDFELPKDFDTILLRYKKDKASITDVFHWKKSDSRLTLYNLTGEDEDITNPFRSYKSKIGSKYLELLKIN